jgi:hypothetical protein
MGYYIEMTKSKFVIKKENFEEALAKLKDVFVVDNMTVCDHVYGKVIPHFRWVHTDQVLESDTLEDALEAIRYVPEYDANGDICNVQFTGQKYGDDAIFLNAISSCVENGSYLCFEGEDGDTWKYYFIDGKFCREYT